MTTAAKGAVYRKSLKLSNGARRNFTVGKIINLISTDSENLNELLPKLNMAWSMPLQIVLALYFLYQELGIAMLAGVAILACLVPFNVGTGKFNTK